MPKKPTLAELQKHVMELTEALQRERADAMNVRRRSDEERAQLGNFYKALIVRELLPVIDNFERALKHVPKEIVNNDFVKGVQGIVKQFDITIERLGVEKIGQIGEVFDPRIHEAVQVDTEGEYDDSENQMLQEKVSEVLQQGYRLGEEVLRPAMVKVKMEK